MKVFVFEHIAGGALIGQPLPRGMMSQGLAMRDALCDDFLSSGIAVITTTDARVESLHTGHLVHEPGELEPLFDRCASQADRTVVIAPESDHVLLGWLERLEANGQRTLNCDPAATRLCSDKLGLYHHLHDAKVPTIATCDLDQATAALQDGSLVAPLVIKPRDGAGCEATFVVTSLDQLPSEASDRPMIVQPWTPGIHASISMVIDEHHTQLLPGGLQHVQRLGDPSGLGQLTYRGGRMPLGELLSRRAAHLAQMVAHHILGLRGFVGVDVILADDPEDDAVVEINPRLTMSYLGLRRLCRGNLAAAMLDPSLPLGWTNQRVWFDAKGRLI